MKYKNTKENYGLIAKFLHWGTAAFFAFSYITVYFRHWFTEPGTSMNGIALHLHLSFGVSIGVIITLRILWRITNKQPALEPSSRLAHLCAHIGHFLLYASTIIMVITGYVGTGTNTQFFKILTIPKFASTSLNDYFIVGILNTTAKSIEPLMDFIHKDVLGSLLLWILILGHASAAFYHHKVLKDRTFLKMT
ncbi:cytochrome b/b6 domain-containing protein [Paraglaciecola sp.]|uniref:cytochrome b n=1 Tax=Paraglaciecola sp. TaxID=1920173 RepID=UPI003262E3DA